MLKVPIDKILPVTGARANISRLVDDVVKGSIYVLTRGGKPAVVVAPVEYIKKVSEDDNIVLSNPSVDEAGSKCVEEEKNVQENAVTEKPETQTNLPAEKPEKPIEPVVFEKPKQQIISQKPASTVPQPVKKNNNSLISDTDDFWLPVEKNIKNKPANVGIDEEEQVPVKIGV